MSACRASRGRASLQDIALYLDPCPSNGRRTRSHSVTFAVESLEARDIRVHIRGVTRPDDREGCRDRRNDRGKALGEALETFKDAPLLAGPTTYTKSCHVPVSRSLLIIRYEDGKPQLDRRPRAAGEVPPYPC